MTNELTQLDDYVSLIGAMEERERIQEMIDEQERRLVILREARDRLDGKIVTHCEPQSRKPKKPFPMRYGISLEGNILALLAAPTNGRMSVAEVWKVLRDDGKNYTRQGVYAALNSLAEKHKIEKREVFGKRHQYEYGVNISE